MNALKRYWEKLNGRERWLVGGAGAAVALMLVYALLWEPWQRHLVQLRTGVPAKQATLQWMRAQADVLKPLSVRKPAGANGGEVPLLTVIEQSAQQAKLREAIQRMQPGENENEVKVWFGEIVFDDWLHWFENMRPQGVEITAVQISRGKEGKVTVRATLARR